MLASYKHLLYCLILLVFSSNLNAFQKNDSLELVVKNSEGKEKIDALLLLSEQYFTSDFNKSLVYSRDALKLSKNINYQLGIAIAYNNIGYSLTDLGNYKEALENYQKSIALFKALKEENREAIAYNDIGYIFQTQGLIEKAIESYIKSLKLLEKLGDKASIGACLNNIGLLYHDQKNFEKALEYYQKSLEVKKEIGDEKSIAVSLNNIGSLYFSQQKYYEANQYFFKSLSKRKKTNDKPGIAQSLINISGIYREQKEYDTALEYLLMSEKIQRELNNSNGLVNTLNNIGVIYRLKGDFKSAHNYLLESYNIAKTIGSPTLIKNTSLSLSNQYKDLKEMDKAYHLLAEHHKMADSIENIENTTKTIKVGLQYEFEKKLHENEMEQMKKDHEHELEIKEQKTISYSFAIGLIALVILSMVILKSLNDKKKANQRITQQKQEIEEKSSKLEEALTNITDSVKYAKRIQQALLQTEEHLSKKLPPHFIFFQPKDIVSGDFYWSYEKGDFLYIAAADCTGHGVPGALMSMLGISFLNSINAENTIISPGHILNKLRDMIVLELGQTNKNVAFRDGMDISLAKINLKTYEVEWAGANNPLWIIRHCKKQSNHANEETSNQSFDSVQDDIVRDNDQYELIEIKPDKQPISKHFDDKPFTNHTMALQKGDTIYLFTDGFADQFGGKKGKKLKYKSFKKLLLSISDKSIQEQKNALTSFFEEWKSDLEQVDDVCVIGIELT